MREGKKKKKGKTVRTTVQIMIFRADGIISGQTENSVWLTLSAITGHKRSSIHKCPWLSLDHQDWF